MTDKDYLIEEIERKKRSIKLIEEGPDYGSVARITFLTNQQHELFKLERELDRLNQLELTTPESSPTTEEENCNAFTDFTKDEESSPAPLESQEELWKELGEFLLLLCNY